MRKLVTALAIGLLVAVSGLGVGAKSAEAVASQARVVIVVGATQGTTAQYRADADAAAAVFAKYTSNVIKVYSPNATWANVQAAAQGASVLVYLGHGSGYPNPYVGYLQPNGDNGMGLNAAAAGTDYNLQYYGENYMAQLGLAPNAIVILNHLCYASGDSEMGRGVPSLSVAQTRVDGYASGFLRGNARAVIAEGLYNIGPYIDAIFATHQTIDQVWKSFPNFHNNVSAWASSQNPGFVSQIDPDYAHPQGDGDVYYRSLVSLPGLSTDDVGAIKPLLPATFVPVAPTRLLDTRNSVGLSGAFSSHVARTFQVTGGVVPAAATSVTGNLTATGQTSAGYLFIGPYPTSNPTSSTVNFPVGDDRANSVTVALGDGGTLSVTYVAPKTGPTANVIFDVTGYFLPDTSGARYVALTPARILDTRVGTGSSGALTSHVARTFAVVGKGGVPTGATAVTGNLTVTQQSSRGFLFLGPVANNDPASSTLNFPVGDDRANGVTVALGDGINSPLGTLSATYVGASAGAMAQVIFDVTGYFTRDGSGARYTALTPSRILDTRFGTGGLWSPFLSHAARAFTVIGGVVPAGAAAVTGNLTVTQQSSQGFLYIGPVATNDPTSSSLNFPVGDDRANAVDVALGGSALFVTFVGSTAGSSAQVIFDVTGYFAP
jgi:hypothetical protein